MPRCCCAWFLLFARPPAPGVPHFRCRPAPAPCPSRPIVPALQSEPNTEAYAAAKAGLLGLAHAQAISLAQRVRVNVVLPGWIDTQDPSYRVTQRDHVWHPAGAWVRRPGMLLLCTAAAAQ